MAFSNFTFEDIETKFGYKNRVNRLFESIIEIKPSQKLKEALQLSKELPVRSKKAKSELIVMPILLELREISNKYFTIYSGDVLIADKKSGLMGECDFILAKDTGSFSINYPIIQIVEAKKHDIEDGIRQCAAQLVGAKIFNEKKGISLKKLYGCATNGDEWQFLSIENNFVNIDSNKYYINNIGELLGIFNSIILGFQKELT